MADARTPERDGNWESMDIFLFTNGQQYSPPRKYHLRADQLTWWAATLNNLADSQFGNSEIQIYTLDGRKVQGPLELSNGGAYVAVHPPDQFIDAGSWEKRQSRKNSNIEVGPDAVIISNEDSKIEDKIEDIKTYKVPEHNLTLESVINAPIPVQVPNVSETQQQATKPPPITKPVEKKRTSVSQRVTTFKKVNPISPPPAKKLSLKPSPPKKLTKPPSRAPNTPQPNLIAKSKIYTKPVFKPKQKEHTVLSKTSLTRLNSNYKMMSTDSAPMDNVIGDKDIILVSNIYKNIETDSKSVNVDNTVQKEQAGVQYTPEIITIDEEIQSYIGKTTDNTERGRVSIQKDEVRNSKIRIVNITPDSNNLLSNNPVDENYVAFINKGDVLNLRLMIEVRNVDNVICSTNPKSQSVTNIFKPQKESQNIMEDEVLIRCNSLQSLIEKEYSQSMHAGCDPKVVVVRCRCQQNEAENDMCQDNASSMHSCNKRYLILLPKSEENTDRFKHDEDIKQNTVKGNEQRNEEITKSETDPVKQTISEILLEKMIKSSDVERRISRDIEAISKRNSIPSQAECSNVVTVIHSEYGNNNESSNIERRISRDIEAISKRNSIPPQAECSNVVTVIHSEYGNNNESSDIERRISRDIEAISKRNSIPPQAECSNVVTVIHSEYGHNNESPNIERRISRDIEAISKRNSTPQAEYSNVDNVINSEYGNNNEATDEYTITKHKEIVTEDKAPEPGDSRGPRSSVVTEKTEYIVRRKSSIKEPIIHTDNTTQTDTSDILLEARLHDDGRYTFHLPPLYMLKQYDL